MAASSTFSYAQAAKGQASQPASSASKVTLPAETPAESPEQTLNADAPSSIEEKQDMDSTNGSESDSPSETTTDRRLESKRDDDAGRLERPWRRAEKGTRSSSATARSVDESDSRKPRKNKKAKASDKQASDQASSSDKEQVPVPEAPKIELSEAPIPPVNIWQQRKEAQAAKTKPAMNNDEESTNGVPGHAEDAKKTPKIGQDSAFPARESTSANGAKPIRKAGDIARPERNGSRGSKSVDSESKDDKAELPPSVQDSASWPTPETAIKEDRRKSSSAQIDRQDKESSKESQDDGSQAKPRQKGKWVAYDYVPSVSFETQIPQMRNSKPRGGARGANGTRASTGTIAGDKAALATPVSKSTESKERPREAGATSNRTASLPPAAKRVSMDASSAKDQKKTSGYTAGDKARDATSSHPTEPGHVARERPEGRGERGRGGYRGRGGHHAINTHSQHQHGASGFTSGSMPSRPQGPYSPPPRQGSHNQMFMPPQQRGGRGRNGAGANFHRMSLPNGSTRLPPVQTQFGPYEYPMAPLTAMPFQTHPYWDNVVMSLLKNQIEYYFSIENLCKDMYLRKRMDSQGFVNLHFVAAFKRIRELTSDMGMIRAVCESSSELDFVVGEDDVERLRRRSGWQSFVLPMEDRDDFARNAGPSHITFKNRPYALGPQFSGISPASFGVSPPLGYNPQGEPQFQQFSEGHGLNGGVNGGGLTHSGSSQLSAEVPDFSPSGPAIPTGSARSDQGAVKSKGAADADGDASPKATTASVALNGCSGEPAANASPPGIESEGPQAQEAAHS
ncbi:la domain-containing protein [Hirsutella rhossiliensis]|uniref:La domain-containing protein n=1 Tax=Hirsutella rhossiliensis TaxID=111463 RepID=A0A9P8MLP6_9HYPO|nr:la domain-containing protein [Hirsutella rhossiliensis]KAH0957309.1 la domain-containing protein [Hirsutella rhossiliensis]